MQRYVDGRCEAGVAADVDVARAVAWRTAATLGRGRVVDDCHGQLAAERGETALQSVGTVVGDDDDVDWARPLIRPSPRPRLRGWAASTADHADEQPAEHRRAAHPIDVDHSVRDRRQEHTGRRGRELDASQSPQRKRHAQDQQDEARREQIAPLGRLEEDQRRADPSWVRLAALPAR